MKLLTRLLFILPILAIGCASTQEPPAPDPLMEQITLLQKQILEVQKTANDTRLKLDEVAGSVNTLTAKVKELEDKQAVAPPPAPAVTQPAPEQKQEPAPVKKKQAKKIKKKKKQPRRQQ